MKYSYTKLIVRNFHFSYNIHLLGYYVQYIAIVRHRGGVDQ